MLEDVRPSAQKHFQIDENQWEPMKIDENQRKLMKIDENRWKSMKITENQWKSMEIHENLWKSMQIVYPVAHMPALSPNLVLVQYWRDTRKRRIKQSMKIYENRWESMKIDENLVNSMKIDENQ